MLKLLHQPKLRPEADPFLWLLCELDEGRSGALLTVTALHGGAPRPVGTHMAVGLRRRFDGYLSGGCVEPAIAAEVEGLILDGRDTILTFGRGSPFFDIRFPCGGGIDVLVHVRPDAELIEDVLDRMAQRTPFALAFEPNAGTASLVDGVLATGWRDNVFVRAYSPPTRLCLAGRGPELEAVARLALASRYEVVAATPDRETERRLRDLPIEIQRLGSASEGAQLPDDPWTATVLLFHEREWEEPILAATLNGPGFYLGALGSNRTHALRRERLLAAGHPLAAVNRIIGPIGTIPAAKDPETLAISLLAEIATYRCNAEANER